MFCPKCGIKIENNNQRFCAHCGSPIKIEVGELQKSGTYLKSKKPIEPTKSTEPFKRLSAIKYWWGNLNIWLRFTLIVIVLIILIGSLSSRKYSSSATSTSTAATRSITSSSKSYIDDEIIVRMACAPEQLEVILGRPTHISSGDDAGNQTWTYENNPREIYSFQNGQVTQIITVEVNYTEDQAVKIQKDMVDQLNDHGFHFYNTRGGLTQYRSSQYPNFAYTVSRMTNTTGSNNVALMLSRPY